MEFLRNLKLTQRFTLLILFVFTGFAVYGFWSFKTLNELKVSGPIYQQIIQGKDIVADVLPPPEYIIESYLVSLQLLNSDKSEHASLVRRLSKLKEEYETRHRYWEQEHLSEELSAIFLQQAYVPATNFYTLAFQEFLPALEQDNRQQAIAVLAKMRTAYETHRQAIDQVVSISNRRVATDEQKAAEDISQATVLLTLVLIITICVTIGLALLISASVTEPLIAMRDMMLNIKNRHDFTLNLSVQSQDEIGDTAQTFNQLIASIQGILQELFQNANNVSQAAHSLAASAQQVAASSQNQSMQAATIYTDVEQVNLSIRHVTEGAQEALVLSCQSGDLSNRGGDIIQNATHTMTQITTTVQQTAQSIEALGQQSHQISSVVQVIKDVADQTNLLALNAAIEAARAGEQGRGFAVVADEVRNLAKRTTKATEEISQMITGIQQSTDTAIKAMSAAVEQADQGALIASQAGAAIEQIKAGSAKVVDVVNKISHTLVDQNKASDSIAAHVEQVAGMAEENKAAANQSASAAVSLEQLAAQMRAALSRFKV